MPHLQVYRRLLIVGAFVLCSLLAGPGPGSCHAEGEDGVYYSQQRHFQIPFHLDTTEGVQSVHLHVSTDGGKSYVQVASASPTEGFFRFHTRQDGWHWFVVQTQDRERRLNPPVPRLVQPGLRVCVDTTPPAITLRSVQPQGGTVAVDWSIRDENVDLVTLTLSYRPTGSKEWIPLSVRQLVEGQFSWSPSGGTTYEVQLRVNDKAGNTGVQMTKVTPVAGGVQPVSAGKGKIIYVKNRTFQLNYKLENVGPSRVKGVEVWYTQDTRSWTKYTSDAPAEGPFSMTAAGEGRWGFTLRPLSGVGLATEEPRPGDQPQIWVEVDETPPAVKLLDVTVGTGPETGKLTVRWSATDAFLRTQPITIAYATEPKGPWTPLATRLNNDGFWVGRCDPEAKLPYQFYLKVEALDEAGNVGSAVTDKMVKVDTFIPRVSTIDVIPSAGPAAPPPGNPTPPPGDTPPPAPPGMPPAPANIPPQG
jgi:hypothetical protein